MENLWECQSSCIVKLDLTRMISSCIRNYGTAYMILHPQLRTGSSKAAHPLGYIRLSRVAAQIWMWKKDQLPVLEWGESSNAPNQEVAVGLNLYTSLALTDTCIMGYKLHQKLHVLYLIKNFHHEIFWTLNQPCLWNPLPSRALGTLTPAAGQTPPHYQKDFRLERISRVC